MDERTVRCLRITGRALQMAASTTALVAATDYSTTGPVFIYVLLATYTTTVFAFWHLVCIEMFRCATRPEPRLSLVSDLVMFVLVATSGTLLALPSSCTSSDCFVPQIVMSSAFIASGAFAWTIAVAFMKKEKKPKEYWLEQSWLATSQAPSACMSEAII